MVLGLWDAGPLIAQGAFRSAVCFPKLVHLVGTKSLHRGTPYRRLGLVGCGMHILCIGRIGMGSWSGQVVGLMDSLVLVALVEAIRCFGSSMWRPAWFL